MVTLPGDVLFSSGKSELSRRPATRSCRKLFSDDTHTVLNFDVGPLAKRMLVIHGHTDNEGAEREEPRARLPARARRLSRDREVRQRRARPRRHLHARRQLARRKRCPRSAARSPPAEQARGQRGEGEEPPHHHRGQAGQPRQGASRDRRQDAGDADAASSPASRPRRLRRARARAAGQPRLRHAVPRRQLRRRRRAR